MTRNGPIKIVMIGAGGIAPAHIETFAKFPERCNVVAVCDLREDVVNEVAGKYSLGAYTDYRTMIDEKQPDLVCILTPPASHREIALDVIGMGKDIFCEKPLAMHVDEGKEMVEAAQKADIRFIVAYCHRFQNATIQIRKAVDAGNFGPITTYRNVFANNSGHRPTRGGNLMDNGSHAVDMMRYIIGDPLKVVGAQFRPKDETDLDKVVDFNAILEGPDGEMAYVEAGGRHAGGRFVLEVFGKETSALYDYGTNTLSWCKGTERDVTQPDPLPSRFDRQAEHLLDCLETGKASINDITEAQKTMEVLDQIRRCALGK